MPERSNWIRGTSMWGSCAGNGSQEKKPFWKRPDRPGTRYGPAACPGQTRRAAMAYEIGYRRPPESGRFKKGKSGNPRGRPKGSANFLTILQQELGQSIVVNENGKKKTITRMQAIVKRIVAGALQGDLKALMTLFEILRRTKFEESGVEALLPENYQ